MDAPFPAGMVEEVERFLADDARRPPGLDLYEDVFKTNMFFPLQRQAELRRMIQIARGHDFGWIKEAVRGEEPQSFGPRTVMEIGADKGGGLYHWCKCLSTVKNVIASEIRGTPYCKLFEKSFPNIDFYWLQASRTSINQASIGLGDRPETIVFLIDVLFIDGDKSAFLADFDAYLPLMNPKGIVLMHDINEPGPMRQAFETVKARGYRTEEVIDISDARAEMDRAAVGIPVSCPHAGWLRHWRGRSCGVGVIYLEKTI